MSSKQVVKVKCSVTNSIGETGYDIYEFYLNVPPIVGTMDLNIIDTVTPAGKTMESIFHVNIKNWFDESTDLF